MKKSLMISITVFILVAIVSFGIVLSKGHIFSYALVKTADSENNEKKEEEQIKPQLEISLNSNSKYISATKKESVELIATIDGEEITDGIEFESSDSSIAKIKDGKVVAVSNGKAKITATYDGLDAETEVVVITPITSMTFTSTSSSIRVGKELQMKLIAKPSDASVDTLSYSSSDEEIATVNANGIVTGVAPGTVTITVTDEYSGLEKSVKLTIRK